MSNWNKDFHRKLLALILSGTTALSLFMPVTAMAAPIENPPSNAVVDSNWTMYLVPNAHIDTAWQWPFEETARDVISATFSKAVKALKDNSNYKFTMSASKHYEWAKEYYPEMYADIKDLIKKGQWDNPGGQVVEPDLNLPSGESLVRQGLEAQRFFKKEFGKMSTVGYVPDTFGFTGQFPQILKKSGMSSFLTTKLNWQDTNVERDSDIFKWKGIDGSQELAYVPMHDYVQIYSDSQIVDALKRNNQTGKETGVKEALGLMGAGDHGGGPDESQYADVLKQNGSTEVDGAQVKLSTITQFFDDVSGKEATNIASDNVRTVDGEMYFENHRGTYTSWARVKQYNRQNEVLAEKAEKAATLGNWLGVLPDSGSDSIDKAWDKILVNQFHDILPGCSIPYQYQPSYNNQELAKNLLNNVESNGLQAMAYRADTKTGVDGIPVMVFNPLSWGRNDTAEVTVSYNGGIPGNLAVYDAETNEKMASSIVTKDSGTGKVTISFEAKDLPAMGYKVFDIREGDGATANDLTVQQDADAITLENDSIKVVIDITTGDIKQIYNKKDGDRQVFADGYEGNELQILKDTGGTDYPAWNVIQSEMNADPVATLNTAPDSIEVVQDTPGEKVVRISRTWSQSTFTQDIILGADSDRVDVKMNVNWNEDNRMLKIAFPFAANADKTSYEIAYGSVDRPTTRDNSVDAAKFEVYGHKWADVTDNGKEFGTSILNDSKYGWDALKINQGGNPATRLRLTAIRSPIGSTVRDPSSWAPSAYNIDKTEHNFTYSIYPHAGTWQEADTVHKADELNYQAESLQVDSHESRGLGTSDSFASSSADNVIISALKTPEDAQGSKTKMILRVYESDGKSSTPVTITLPSEVKSAKEVNMIEYDDSSLNKPISVDGKKISFSMGPYEITTIALDLDAYADGTKNVSLKDAQADLFQYYNVDAVSSNDKKGDGNLDGKGDTIPAELWPNTVKFQGVDFNLGPTKDGYKNMVQANGQKIALPDGNYKYLYILGAGAGSGDKSGTFTINMSDGTKVAKDLKFADWDTNLSGWDRFTNKDLYPYVKDQVGYFFTHFHNGVTDRMTVDNYLFVYAIPIDPSKKLDSIELPAAGGIKIAAISAADSDYLRTMKIAEASTETLPAITGVHAALVEGPGAVGDQVKVTWEPASGISSYKIYRGTAVDFTLNNAIYVGSALSTQNSFVDTLPYQGEFVYKVVGSDSSQDQTLLSNASEAVAGGLDNAFLTVPQNSITAPGGYANEEPYRACDGNTSTKWCFRQDGVYLQVDLGEGNDWKISKFTLINAGAENTDYITRDFRVDCSDDGNTWTTIRDIKENKLNQVDIVLDTPITSRYFKLVPYYAGQVSGQSNCPRIYEFQAWGTSSKTYVPAAQNVTIGAYTDRKDTQKVTFTCDYEYVNAGATGTEGQTAFQWSKSMDGTTFEPIPDATGKTFTVNTDDALSWKAVKLAVTPVDKNGVAGQAEEKVMLLNDPNQDILEGKPATASNQFKAAEAGSMLTDGSYTTKWCADGVYPTSPRTAIIDAGAFYDFSKIVLWHATGPVDANIPGANTADNNKAWNTRDYKIYVSSDKQNWKEITNVVDNTDSVTTHTYEPGTAVGRYLKLEVTKGVDFGADGNTPNDGNSCVRIYEMLGYGTLLSFVLNDAEEVSDVTPENVTVTNETAERLPIVGDQLKVNFDVAKQYVDLARFRWQIADSTEGPYTTITDSYGDTLAVDSSLYGKWVRANVRIDQGPTVFSDPVKISENAVDSGTISSFYPLNPEVLTQKVAYGTTLEELNLPSVLEAVVDGISNVLVKIQQWASDIAYDPLQAGAYRFTPVLDSGYVVDSGAVPPEIQVEVGRNPKKTISSFGPLSDSEAKQEVTYGTPLSALRLPTSLNAAVDGTEGTVSGITWSANRSYDPYSPGVYIFTAVLPQGYILAEDVEEPILYVTVQQKSAENSKDHSGSSNSNSSSNPSGSVVTIASNAQGGSTATVNTRPDTTPSVSGGRAVIVATVPSDVVSVITSATQANPGEIKVMTPTDDLIGQLRNNDVKAVQLSLQIPEAMASNTNTNVRISVHVDRSVLQQAKDAQKDFLIAMVNSATGKELYSWAFTGAVLERSVTSVNDLDLAVNVIPVKTDATVAPIVIGNTEDKSTAGLIVKFANNGLLPGNATVRVYVGNQENGTPNSKLFPYALDCGNSTLKHTSQGTCSVDQNGFVTLTISQCSDYVLLPNPAANPYPVTSDTYFPVGIQSGRSYTFAMTISNGETPYFAVGNGNAFTCTTRRIGTKYYVTVTAIGKAGMMTALYSTLPARKPVLHCYLVVRGTDGQT